MNDQALVIIMQSIICVRDFLGYPMAIWLFVFTPDMFPRFAVNIAWLILVPEIG